MSLRSSRGSDGRLRVYLLVAVLAVTAPLMVAVATDAFSTATLSRQANADVVADSEGPLGIDVSAPATGTTSEYLGLTNQFGEEVSVSVTLADGSKGDLVGQGGTAGDSVTFSLAAGARESVELSVPCNESLEGQAVAATIEVSGSGVSGTFERSATIESGCSTSTGDKHVTNDFVGGINETSDSSGLVYIRGNNGKTLDFANAYYKINGVGDGGGGYKFLDLSDPDGDGQFEANLTGLSPGDNITYYFEYGINGGSSTSETYSYTFGESQTTTTTATTTTTSSTTTTTTSTTTTTTTTTTGQRHETSEYIAGLNETGSSSVRFYIEPNNGNSFSSAAVTYSINGNGNTTVQMDYNASTKQFFHSISGLSSDDTITYSFRYGNSYTETWTYTFKG